MELFEELKWRGLVDNVTSEEVEDVINNGEVTFYIGTDPTADSLHIGHYSSLLMAKRLDSGISYTEFSYMILQSLDFLNLYQTRGCTMQIGGQDQWGNITSGLELIRKKCGADVKCYGLTMPLITKADGTKFGKSETGTVWLDPKKTSPYELYQFLFNTDDSKVIEYLKKLTFLTKEEIDALEVSLKEDAGRREAQKKLAEEVVRDLHGEEGLESALKITNALFRGQLNDLDEQQRLDAVKNMDKVDQEAGKTLIDVLVEAKIASSRREAREWIKGNSISLNGVKVNDETLVIDSTQAYVSNYVIIRRGKKRYYCLNLK